MGGRLREKSPFNKQHLKKIKAAGFPMLYIVLQSLMVDGITLHQSISIDFRGTQGQHISRF